jgi:hypothetical protein
MARPILKISKDFEDVVLVTSQLAKEYARATSDKKDKIEAQLKMLIKNKEMLKTELQESIQQLDKNIESQINEIRKLIKEDAKQQLAKAQSKLKGNL